MAKGADAYFKYVNAHGGVNGRKIKYDYVDDAYDPSQTIQKTRELVGWKPTQVGLLQDLEQGMYFKT